MEVLKTGTLWLGVQLQNSPLSDVFDPGMGTAPPGSGKFHKILNWGAWIAVIACIAGVIFVAAKMAIAHRRHEGSEHGASLGFVMAACILVGSASGIVAGLT